jgi:hypothetical protein
MKHTAGDGSPLKMPITSLGLSGKFTSLALQHGFSTLEEFQQLTIRGLLEIDWLTAELRSELIIELRWIQQLSFTTNKMV